MRRGQDGTEYVTKLALMRNEKVHVSCMPCNSIFAAYAYPFTGDTADRILNGCKGCNVSLANPSKLFYLVLQYIPVDLDRT